MLVAFASSLSVSSAEFLTPVLAASALGWTGATCGIPLVVMAVSLFLGQLAIGFYTHRGGKDLSVLSVGSVLYPVALLAAVLVWKIVPLALLGIVGVLWNFAVTAPLGACCILGTPASLRDACVGRRALQWQSSPTP